MWSDGTAVMALSKHGRHRADGLMLAVFSFDSVAKQERKPRN
jgi:hypothetical protein